MPSVRTPLDFLLNKVYRLLIPFVLIVITAAVAEHLPSLLQGRASLGVILSGALQGIVRGTHMWFLPVLFECEVLMLIVVRLLKDDRMGLAMVAVLLVCLGNLIPPRTEAWMNLDVVPVAFSAFVFGYFIRESGMTKQNRVPVMGWVCLALYFLVPRLIAAGTGRWHYMNIFEGVYTDYAINMIQMFTGVYAVFALMPHVRIPRFVAALGRNSLFYYGYHMPMRVYAFKLFSILLGSQITEKALKATVQGRWLYLSISVAIMLFLAPCCYLTNKLFPMLVGKTARETKPWWYKKK